MDEQKLKRILAGHKIWLETEARGGERALLKGADLTGADLMRANLQRADLRNVVLQNANLQEANLQEANLKNADLKNADLRIAYLRLSNLNGADLERANLRGADLWVSDLSNANLKEANLREANLQESNLKGAVLEGANLKFVKLTRSTYDQIPETVKSVFAKSWHVIGADEAEDDEVEQFIDFPLAQRSSVIRILEDFAGALDQRFTDQPGVIRISFQGEKVFLAVDPADGERVIIENYLKIDEAPRSGEGGVFIDMSAAENGNAAPVSHEQPSLDIVSDIESRLKRIKRLYDDGLITREELTRKRAALLERL